jgi:hypothetical protein
MAADGAGGVIVLFFSAARFCTRATLNTVVTIVRTRSKYVLYEVVVVVIIAVFCSSSNS